MASLKAHAREDLGLVGDGERPAGLECFRVWERHAGWENSQGLTCLLAMFKTSGEAR